MQACRFFKWFRKLPSARPKIFLKKMATSATQSEAPLLSFGRQSHLLRFWKELSEEQRAALVSQYKGIDVDDAAKVFSDSAAPIEFVGIEGIQEDHYAVASEFSASDLDLFWRKGLEAIANGKVAALVMAGGQATRLGAALPKGMLSLGLEGCDSLFSLQAARIARLQKLAKEAFPDKKGVIQWLVMTSRHTEMETRGHLEKIVPEWGLSMDQVTVFNQGEIPCYDLEGNFILADKGKIAMSPDGNGGLFAALAPYLKTMGEKGVEYFHVFSVDNILCRVADPHFIGLCAVRNADCAAKAVQKTDPAEAVGVICRVGGKVRVLEYSELSKDLTEKRDAHGRLELRAGNIANHLFTLEFLQRVCTKDCRLPFHRAFKKIPYVDENGVLVKPTKPNGIKLEQFVFDVFQYSKNFYVWDVLREREFSPLKNAESAKVDCLSTCRRDISAEHRRWLKEAKASLKGDGFVFIHPLRSYAGEGLEDFEGQTVETPAAILPKM